jgi:hypothetical protein
MADVRLEATIPNDKATHVDVSVRQINKLAVLSVYPIRIRDGMVSYTITSGARRVLEDMPRLNRKRLGSLASSAKAEISAKAGLAWDLVMSVCDETGVSVG